MRIRIVADSSADLLSYDGVEFASAPLRILTDTKEYIDDENLDVMQFVKEMRDNKGKSSTACPGVGDYISAFDGADWVFVVTISSNLSGSYNSAMVAKNQYISDYPNKKVYVIDSLSAGPEMAMIVEKLAELINEGKEFEEIANAIDKYKEMGIDLKDVYEVDKTKYLSEQKDSMTSAVIVAVIMLVISLIEIVLMMRSSFLSRIKEVGIYRAIGVKKSDIYKMFIGESFAISTFASVPGVLFMSYCLYILSDISYIGSNYVMNIYVFVLCLGIMYLFNIVVGLIPVFNTMRKTPAEILSRHDLD